MFLGLQGLVQAFGITPARHHAAGEFVDDDDLIVLDDIVLVAAEQAVGAQRLLDVVNDGDVLGVVEIVALEKARRRQHLLQMHVALFSERAGALFLVKLVVLGRQFGDEFVDGVIEIGLVVDRTGNDERSTRLVDEDRVDFVDDGEVVAALHHLFEVILHVVAEIIEAQLVVGGVGHVAGIGGAALGIVEAMDHHAGGEAEKTVDLAHPAGVAAGEIVVDGDDMDAVLGQGIEVDGERGDKRLAFAGFHFGDAALMQRHAADHLDIEMALSQGALGGFAHGGKGRRQQVIEGLAGGQLLAEHGGAGAQGFIAQGGDLGFKGVDLIDAAAVFGDLAVIGRAENFCGDRAHSEHVIRS